MAAIQSVDLREVEMWAKDIGLKAAHLQVPLRKCAIICRSETLKNFQRSHDPDGKAWPPLKRPRKRPKGAKGGTDKPLMDKGILMGSVTARGRGNDEDIVGNELAFGSNLVYAAVHNYGYPPRKIPQRQFLGVTEHMKMQFQEIFQAHLMALIVEANQSIT